MDKNLKFDFPVHEVLSLNIYIIFRHLKEFFTSGLYVILLVATSRESMIYSHLFLLSFYLHSQVNLGLYIIVVTMTDWLNDVSLEAGRTSQNI